MEYVYFVIVLALIEYMVLGGIVGHARGKHGVRAPDCVGPDDFNRKFRVHQNTLEALVIFLPAIWICGRYLSPTIAAVLGLVWIVGRAMYARSYIKAPESRGPGAAICGFMNIFLVLGGLVGLVRQML